VAMIDARSQLTAQENATMIGLSVSSVWRVHDGKAAGADTDHWWQDIRAYPLFVCAPDP
jgi:hypothetical protein